MIAAASQARSLVDEQIRGGLDEAIGGALYERCIYSEDGQLLNGTLADYLLPMAGEMPDIDVFHVSTPTFSTQLGAKGVGEAGTIGGLGCIWTAVNDALRPLGARVTHQPFTPEHVLTAIGAAHVWLTWAFARSHNQRPVPLLGCRSSTP